MNPANTSNASTSATTSSNAHKTRSPDGEAPAPDAATAKLSEAEFLEQQAAAAKSAIASAFAELKTDLATGVDPRIWIKSHPWLTLASVSAAGFVAASTLIPSKEQQALRKLEAIERAMHAGHDPAKSSNGHADGKKKESGGLLGVLLHELFSALKPILLTLITSNIPADAPVEPSAHDST